jgi:2',3'-cyclic-nucleotide 2'-phosphodiesterase (5'-nucleotidase family)
MKFNKKLLALILVLVMVAAFFVGCVSKDDVAALEKKIDDLNSQITSLTGEGSKKDGEISDLEAEVADLEAKLAALEGEKAAADEALAAAEAEKAALADALSGKAGFELLPELKGGKGVVLLNTNDTHGRLAANASQIGFAGAATLKELYEAAGFSVVLVDAGDHMQGTPLVNESTGASAVEFMNAAGYDIAVPGNHEFDWGTVNFLTNIKDAEAAYIAANVRWTAEAASIDELKEFKPATGKLVLPANKIISVSGSKIGFFGLATAETATKAHPDKVKGVEFIGGDAMNDIAKAQVAELKAAGCDLIVCVAHLGVDSSSAPNRSEDVIAAVDGIDLFIDGHSHSEIAGRLEKNTLLVSSGNYFENIGVTVFADDKLSSELVAASDFSNAFGQVAAFLANNINNSVAALDAEINEVLGAKFAETKVELIGTKTVDGKNVVRWKETNMGNFAADALLWQAREYFGSSQNVDIAITNGGGIRATIPAGPVSMLDLKTVFPFGNILTVISITGEQLVEALEAACFSAPAAVGAFPQVAGLTFEIHSEVAYKPAAQPYEGSTYYGPAYAAGDARRIQNVKVNGVAIDLAKVYTLATNDFTAAGGDTYAVLKAGTGLFQTGIAMEDCLVNYMKSLGNVVTGNEVGIAGDAGAYKVDVNNRIFYK